jgi:hypothetical protein
MASGAAVLGVLSVIFFRAEGTMPTVLGVVCAIGALLVLLILLLFVCLRHYQ